MPTPTQQVPAFSVFECRDSDLSHSDLPVVEQVKIQAVNSWQAGKQSFLLHMKQHICLL